MYSKGNEVGTIRQLQVPEQCTELVAGLELLEKQLGELEQRLSLTVLRQDPVKLNDEHAGVKAVELVPFAESLRQRVWHVQKLQNIVSSMLQRLEL